MTRVYLTPTGELTNINRNYIAEQIVNDFISIIYSDTSEDKSFLEAAALRLGEEGNVLDVARASVQGCQINNNDCTNNSCSGTCEFVPGSPSFKTCKCKK
jgi:hypothetical protein